MPKFLYLVIALLAFFLTACGTSVPSIKPYKLEIQQGNVVTSKMLLQLKPGMTKSQVRYIMGTPLIQDSFHGNRWDYFYQMRESGRVTAQRKIFLTFKNGLLDKVNGDVVPQGSAEAESSEGNQASQGARVVEPQIKRKEKGFFDRFKFWGEDELEEIEVPKPSERPIDIKPGENAEEESKKGFFSRLKFWGDDDNASEEMEQMQESAEEKVENLSGVEIQEQPVEEK